MRNFFLEIKEKPSFSRGTLKIFLVGSHFEVRVIHISQKIKGKWAGLGLPCGPPK